MTSSYGFPKHGKRWLLLTSLLTLAVAVFGIVVLLKGKDISQAPQQQAQTKSEESPTSSGAPMPRYLRRTWAYDMEELPPRISFDPANPNVNIPVKGQLQVNINPADIERLPGAVDIYKMLPMVGGSDELEKIAARFGLHKVLSSTSVINTQMASGLPRQELLYDYQMDVLRYRDNEHDLVHKSDVPSKERCKNIAMQIAKDKGLLVQDAVVMATNETSRWDDSSPTRFAIERRDIVIGRTVDGLDVRGPGYQFRITLGSRGKPTEIYNCMRPLVSLGSYKLKSLEQALEEASKGLGTMNLEPDTIDPTVTDVEVFYYAEASTWREESDPAVKQNRALLPVYAFMGHDCCIYVPAFGERIE